MTFPMVEFIRAQKELLERFVPDAEQREALAVLFAQQAEAVANGADPASLVTKAEPQLPTPGVLPPGMAWPTETYSYAHREYGWDIECFLKKRWKALIAAGVVTRPVLREIDPSCEKAIANYLTTGRRLPQDLHVPTKRELTDRALKLTSKAELQRGERLSSAARYRSRRDM